MEEANMCGVDHLDINACLPPRKRLLAGLKKQQNCDLPSSSSSLSSISCDFNTRLSYLRSSNSSSLHISLEEIVDASRSAALAAAKVAVAAKAAAEEKAAVAAKAAAAARCALELVASFSEKETRKERCPRKNKLKKHVQIKFLYGKRHLIDNCETDEELARKLHQAMNSSPRISKSAASSGCKIHKHKKDRKNPTLEKTRISNGRVVQEGNSPSTCDSNAEAGDLDQEGNTGKLDEKSSGCTQIDCSDVNSFPADGKAEASCLKGQVLEETITTGRKRGRIKQKKLSLSLCAIRDRENSKEEPESSGFPLGEEPKDKCIMTNVPSFPVKPSTVDEVSTEAVSTWKFKEFNAPPRYTGSNILLSLCSNPTVTTGSAVVEVDQ